MQKFVYCYSITIKKIRHFITQSETQHFAVQNISSNKKKIYFLSLHDIYLCIIFNRSVLAAQIKKVNFRGAGCGGGARNDQIKTLSSKKWKKSLYTEIQITYKLIITYLQLSSQLSFFLFFLSFISLLFYLLNLLFCIYLFIFTCLHFCYCIRSHLHLFVNKQFALFNFVFLFAFTWNSRKKLLIGLASNRNFPHKWNSQ